MRIVSPPRSSNSPQSVLNAISAFSRRFVRSSKVHYLCLSRDLRVYVIPRTNNLLPRTFVVPRNVVTKRHLKESSSESELLRELERAFLSEAMKSAISTEEFLPRIPPLAPRSRGERWPDVHGTFAGRLREKCELFLVRGITSALVVEC